jgi:hypothetical protein
MESAMANIEHGPKLTDEAIAETNGRSGLSLSREQLKLLIASAWAMAASPDVRPIDDVTTDQLEKVAKAFRSAAAALAVLDENGQRWFALFAETGERFGFDGDPKERRFNMEDVKFFPRPDPASKTYAYRQFAEGAAKAASSWKVAFRSRKGKKGRKPHDVYDPGNPDVPLWDVFVDQCLWVTEGKLSIEKNGRTGTLVRFLDALKPHLPPNFVKSASGPALARIWRTWLEKSGKKR